MSANSSAIKRIQRDILEWRESARHFPNIGALPLEDDIFTWHFNVVVGDEVALHGQIKFPNNYPFAPPRVHFFGNVPHRQVPMVGRGQLAKLCLDVLQGNNHGFYAGWSSAYSIVSVFAQIETLLHRLGKNQIIAYWGNFHCRECGHDGADIDKFVPDHRPSRVGLSDEEMKTDTRVWSMLNADVEGLIYGFMSQEDLRVMVHVCASIQQLLYHYPRLYHYRTVECYHSKSNFGDFCELQGAPGILRTDIEKMLFGIGFNADYWENTDKKTGEVESVLKDVYVSTDVLSYGAFTEGVNFSTWRDFKFTNFIPIYLNDKHGSLSLPLAERIMKECFHIPEGKRFDPVLALRFLTKLMNTTVVSLMNEVEEHSEAVHLFTSTKALQTYLYFYHLLLGFAKKYPKILKFAQKKVNTFMNKPDKRDKKHFPDLGEFLIYLSLVPVSWSEFGPIFEEEAMTRNAKWILKEHPSLITTHSNTSVSCVRLNKSWEVSKIGKRLQMFQYYFLHHICGVGEVDPSSPDLDLDGKLVEYNKCLGQVEQYIAVGLQRRCRDVFRVDDWLSFYDLINLPCPTARRLSHEMRQAMVESDRKGYHRFLETPVGESQPHEDPDLCMCSGNLMSIATRNKQIEREQELIGEADGKERDPVDDGEKRYIDVAFCVDCTGSMDPYLEQVKKNMKQIARALHEEGNIDVRFAIVGYRNHTEWCWGHDWTKETKVSNFSNLKKFEKNLVGYECRAGGGPYEAVACGWNDITRLDWRRFAVKAVIQIADIGCQGQLSAGNACPLGHDAIELAREMLSRDITMYSVGCTDMDRNSENFFRGTAHLTGGMYVTMQNVKKLPGVIVESTKEGVSLTDVVPLVWKLLKENRAWKPRATRDQLAYFVWRDLVEKNVSTRKVKSAAMDDNKLTPRVIALSEAKTMDDCRRILKSSEYDDTKGAMDTLVSGGGSAMAATEPAETSSRDKGKASSSGFVQKFRTYDEYAKDQKRRRRQAQRARARRQKKGQMKEAERKRQEQPQQQQELPNVTDVQDMVAANENLITFEQTLRCIKRAEQMGHQMEWLAKGCVYRMEKYMLRAAEGRFQAHGLTYNAKMRKIKRHKFSAGDRVEYNDYRSHRIYPAEVTRIDRNNFSITVRLSGTRTSRSMPMTSKNLTKMGTYLTRANKAEHGAGVIDPNISQELRAEIIREEKQQQDAFFGRNNASSRRNAAAAPRRNQQPSFAPAARVPVGINRRQEESEDLVRQIRKSNAPNFSAMVQGRKPETTADDMKHMEETTPVEPIAREQQSVAAPTRSRERAVAIPQYLLTESDMVVKSALCVIPPKELWGPIQDIRQVYDKGYARWMPHMNILYPYVPSGVFAPHAQDLEVALAALKMQPFRVQFTGFDYFDRRPSSRDPDPKLYVFLKTRVVAGEVRSWDNLMRVMKRMYPNYAGRKEFKPHLTVGQIERSKVRDFVATLNRSFSRAEFDVNEVNLISRSGFSTPFRVDHVVRFGV